MSAQSLKILILEDNDDLREGWSLYFQRLGHSVQGVGLADELLEMSAAFVPDVYVIDLNLPDADGLHVVKRLREVQPNAGIVITTARTHIGDKLVGYDNGADIYFTKPIDPQELMAGISALARRRVSAAHGGEKLVIEWDRYRLRGPLSTVDLTPSETSLLVGMAHAAGQPLARWQIAELLGFADSLPTDAMLEMRIARLRKRLVAAGAPAPAIKALHKQGYVLCCPVVLA